MYDILTEVGFVKEKLSTNDKIDIIRLRSGEKAINYRLITGEIKKNNRVLLNTTAVRLGLGTGGYHFIICNLDNTSNKNECNSPGHIMKMRYTPQQLRTLCVEEKDSPYHTKMEKMINLRGQIVVILPLHSLLAPLAIVFKKMFPNKNLIYIMTEGGSLSLDVSFLIKELKTRNYIDSTITIGQCFGGDLEAINIFTGIIAAKEVCNADMIAVSIGPGIVGTGTELGFSGVENVFVNYAVRVLGGKSFIVPRISLSEKRQRHYLISHHTVTLLNKLIDRKETVIFPQQKNIINKIKELKLNKKHDIIYYKYNKIKRILVESGFKFNSMGRNFTDDPLFFITGGLPVLRYNEIIKE